LAYIGQRPVIGRYIKLDQISSGFNGSNTGFSMTAGSQAVFPGTARNLLLSLGGVIQEPDTDFTISGSTLTFTTAPVANTTFFGVIYGDMQATGTPSDGTVLPASIASSGNFSFPQLTVTSSASLLGGAVFNENGADVDFRVEGDTVTHLLFVDANADRVGIGTSSPSSKLTIEGAADNVNSELKITATGISSGYLGSDANGLNIGTDTAGIFFKTGVTGGGSVGATGSVKMAITSTGLVGIGETNPAGSLHINAASGVDGPVFESGGTNNTNHALIVRDSNATQLLRINNNGKIGIGTTSPDRLLHVRSTGDALFRITSGDGSAAYIELGDASNGDAGKIVYDNGDNLTFTTTNPSDNTTTEKLRIQGNGNVGIGETGPSYPTEIKVSDTTAYSQSTTNSTQHQLRINNAGLNGVAGILLTAEPSSGSAGHAGIRVVSPSSGKADMTFSVRDAGTYDEKLRILNNGNVGIGTTSPDGKLDVRGTIFVNGDGTGGRLFASSGNLSLSDGNGRQILRIDDPGASNSHSHIFDSNGRLGIGTTSPAQKLDVNGAGIIRGNTQVLGTITTSINGNQSTQGGAGLVMTHSTNTNLRANHFVVDDFPSGGGTYFIQATESGVSNERHICMQGYGGKVKIGNQGTAPDEKLDVEGNIKIRGGDLKISNGRGIDFSDVAGSASGSASALLDDYEEGTHSPTMVNLDVPSHVTVDHFNYTKIGRLVHINAKFTVSGSVNDLSGVGFSLPFTQAGSRENVFTAISTRSGSNTAPFAFVINANQSNAYAKELDGFGTSEITYNSFSGDIILVTGTYESN